MKLTLTLILAAACAVLMAGPSSSEWNRRYQAVGKTIERMDIPAYRAMFTKDFSYTGPDGKKANRAEFFQQVDGLFAMAKKIKGSVKVKSVTQRGNMVDVMFDVRMSLSNKTKGTTLVHEVGTDTWRKVGGKWLMAKTMDSVFTVHASE